MPYTYDVPPHDAPPALASTLGMVFAWCVLLVIVLFGVKLLLSAFFKTVVSTVEGVHKVHNAFHPPPPMVTQAAAVAGAPVVSAPEAKRVLLPGMIFGRKSWAESMKKTVERDHPELAPEVKPGPRGGYGVEINDVDE